MRIVKLQEISVIIRNLNLKMSASIYFNSIKQGKNKKQKKHEKKG